MKKVLPILLLAAASNYAHADTWTFAYQGFYDVQEGAFDPNERIAGKFQGSDLDGDRTIELSELTYFEMDGFAYHGVQHGGDMRGSVPSFSYALTGELQFTAKSYFSDGNTVTSYSVTAGEGAHLVAWTFLHDRLWTDQTTFTISPPPVPEPATYAMLAAGSLLLGARHRRRARSDAAQRALPRIP